MESIEVTLSTSIALFEGDYTIRRTYKTSLYPLLDGSQPQQEKLRRN